jgi:hypothetical protein
MRPVALAASCAAILLALGARAHAEEPASTETEKADPVKSATAKSQPEAPAYPPPGARWGVIGVGLAASAVFYGAAAGMSYAFPDAPGARDLRTPIAGPWMAIAHNGCAVGDDDCSRVWIVMRTIATAIGGLGQAGGILVALEGVFMPTQYAPEAPARRAPKAPPAEPTPSPEPPKPGDKNLFWIPTPMALGNGGMGVGVVGRF